MLTMHWETKQGDTSPPLRGQLRDDTGLKSLETATSVTLRVVNRETNVLLFAKPCVITDAVNGWLEYRWEAGDTVPGSYDFEFVIVWNDTTQDTVPKSDGYKLRINPALEVSSPS